jgi:hypothetical protein
MERKDITDIISVLVLIIAFIFLFFVKYAAIPNPCTWQVCPDAGGGGGWSSLIDITPNFYTSAGCFFGVGGQVCYESRFSTLWLIIDILLFSIVAAATWAIRKRM